MNELIKTLQIWSENPMASDCNVSNILDLCKGVRCSECPMNIYDKIVDTSAKSLGEFNERTNKNIKPNNS